MLPIPEIVQIVLIPGHNVLRQGKCTVITIIKLVCLAPAGRSDLGCLADSNTDTHRVSAWGERQRRTHHGVDKTNRCFGGQVTRGSFQRRFPTFQRHFEESEHGDLPTAFTKGAFPVKSVSTCVSFCSPCRVLGSQGDLPEALKRKRPPSVSIRQARQVFPVRNEHCMEVITLWSAGPAWVSCCRWH